MNKEEIYRIFYRLYRLEADEDNYLEVLYQLGKGLRELSKEAKNRLKNSSREDIEYMSNFIRGLISLEEKVLGILRRKRGIDFTDIYNGFETQKQIAEKLLSYNGRYPDGYNPIIALNGIEEYADLLAKRAENLLESTKRGYRTLSIISIILSLAFLSYLSFNTSNTGMITSIGFSSASIAASLFLFLVSLFLLLKSKIFKKH